MSEQHEKKPNFLLRSLRFLVRLLLIILVGAVIGGGLYYGFTVGYQRVFQPLQEHEMRLNALESYYDEETAQVSRQLADLQSRVDRLEMGNDTQKETLVDMENRLQQMEKSLEADEEALAALKNDFGEIDIHQGEVAQMMNSLEDDLSAMQSDVKKLFEQVGDLSAAREADKQVLDSLLMSVEDSDSRWESIGMNMEVLRVLELLTRSRFSLAQGNVTIAKADIQDAHQRLMALADGAAANQVEILTSAVDYLDDALAYLPRSPLAAADKVEGAWAVLIDGVPNTVTRMEEGEPLDAEREVVEPTETPEP